jgi:glutamate racemase
LPSNIVIFDSGMGGLTVAGAVARCLPDAKLHYVADTAAFPYGAWDEAALVERICAVAAMLIDDIKPDCFVVACNTASTIALDELRARFKVPFVGTVPAIKPAAALTTSGVFGVLATSGTAKREYTQALIDTFAFHCEVVLHGSAGLAALAERKLHGGSVARREIEAEIAPVFVSRPAGRTDVVVLGCTHYPLLLDEIRGAAPWEVAYVDPADAIARQVAAVVGEAAATTADSQEILVSRATVTSQDGLKLADVFANFGYRQMVWLEVA